MLIILFARSNLPKSFLEELETDDKINFSGRIRSDSGYIPDLAGSGRILDSGRILARMWFPGMAKKHFYMKSGLKILKKYF